MGSCRVRELARARTIPQLRAAGLDPIVFLSPCDPAGPEQNRLVALEAMQHAAALGHATLYVEDDIDVDPILFPWALDLAERLDAVTYLYLNDQPARLRFHFGNDVTNTIMERGMLTRGAYAIRTRAALFGTQAVMIPARLLGTMVDILEDTSVKSPRQPWDGRLHTWLKRHPEERVFSILPHPVQHRQDRTGRQETRTVMRSMSYGMSWTDAIGMEFVDDWHDHTRKYQPVLRTKESIVRAFVERRMKQRDQQ